MRTYVADIGNVGWFPIFCFIFEYACMSASSKCLEIKQRVKEATSVENFLDFWKHSWYQFIANMHASQMSLQWFSNGSREISSIVQDWLNQKWYLRTHSYGKHFLRQTCDLHRMLDIYQPGANAVFESVKQLLQLLKVINHGWCSKMLVVNLASDFFRNFFL